MAKVNDEGKEYIADVSSGLRLTADIPNGELGYVLMAQLVTRYGITELLEINESDLNTQTRVGVYKYGIMQPGATKTDYGMLFVYSSDVPSSGSGDYPLYQTRFQGGLIQTRSRTMPNGLWTDWEDVGGSGVGKPGSGENSEVFNDMENNQAAGDCAHAEGSWTVANNEAEHAEGVYNKSNTGGSDSGKTLHSVGIGTADNARKNAHEIMLNGDHYVYGIGGYDGTNPGTAKTLQEVVNEGGGITDLGVVSGWNDVVDTGIYKYTLTTENGISGLLFVTSAPKRDGSGKDHYQVRMEAGKIYSRTGESLNIVSGRYTWQDWEEVGGGSSVSVVQSTGQSTTAVMSQKAVTDAIDNLNNGVMQDEGLYEDVDTYGEAYSRTSTNGEMMGYVNHRIEEYAVGADAPDIFTYDEQVPP